MRVDKRVDKIGMIVALPGAAPQSCALWLVGAQQHCSSSGKLQSFPEDEQL